MTARRARVLRDLTSFGGWTIKEGTEVSAERLSDGTWSVTCRCASCGQDKHIWNVGADALELLDPPDFRERYGAATGVPL